MEALVVLAVVVVIIGDVVTVVSMEALVVLTVVVVIIGDAVTVVVVDDGEKVLVVVVDPPITMPLVVLLMDVPGHVIVPAMVPVQAASMGQHAILPA